MKCEDVDMLLSDLLAGRLAPAETNEVNRHLETCAACRQELAMQRRLDGAIAAARAPEPGPRLRFAFHAWLDAEKRALQPARRDTRHHGWWFSGAFLSMAGAIAACIIFAFGLLVGTRVAPDRGYAGPDPQTARELAELRSQVNSMGQAVAWSMLQEESPNDRLKTVLALNAGDASPTVANELLGVMAYDRSSSVRLSAVEALARYSDHPTVRHAVASGLAREPSAVVQLAMIDLLANTRDPDAAQALQQFASSETPDVVVRDAANVALARM